MRKTKKQLEDELKKLREFHLSLWETYGSELCVGDMVGKEKKLQDLIKQEEKYARRRRKEKARS